MRLSPVKEIAPVSKVLIGAVINAALQRTGVDLLPLPGYWGASILVLFQAQTCKVLSAKLE